MPEYLRKQKNRLERARVALNMKNTEKKDVNARQYVENLNKSWGAGVSTLCLIYNATGDTVRFVTSRDWQGHSGPSPPPQLIANGQWGGFLHVNNSRYGHIESSAAVVYRGKNENGIYCDWMLAWSNPMDRTFGNYKAYTEIGEANHFGDVWGTVSNLLTNSGVHRSDIRNGCLSTVITGCDTSPIFEGILTLENA
ncbi:hypothetical protein F0562_029455 [Nyssa sinensis]|uniref:23 kDa jasmonate-induced protein-like n=1 Tax=Nyssa sinensis TaxID=561372 RepID=A0A5J5B588_9ASTE|nr:hypothetical protein F0562_029455 [Nyssa sinensis]